MFKYTKLNVILKFYFEIKCSSNLYNIEKIY